MDVFWTCSRRLRSAPAWVPSSLQ